MRLNLPPLNAWVLCENEGYVLCAHCTCMAGLGEACSHVGAVLFAIEEFVRLDEEAPATVIQYTF